jgi:hypothetical protein
MCELFLIMLLIVSKLCEMFAPDPSNLISWIILVFGEPKLALFSYDIKDLPRLVFISK